MLTTTVSRHDNAFTVATIRCSNCNANMDGKEVCPRCGHTHCWVAVYYQGNRHRVTRGSDGFPLDYGRADALRGEIRTAINKGTYRSIDYEKPQNNIVSKVYETWIEIKERSRRPSSVKDLKGHMNNYILPFFGSMNINDVRKHHVTEFLNSLPDTIKNKTKKNIILTLRSFFNWCVGEELRKGPLSYPELNFENDSKERIALDYEDQQKYLAMIPEKHRPIIEFGMETGLRPGELVVLQCRDVDLRQGTLFVRRTISAYVNVIESTKGHRKDYIPLSDRAIEIALNSMGDRIGEPWLFINPDTCRRYAVKMPNVVWKRYTGLDLVYYEASRHSFVTQLIDEGHDAVQVMQLSRHSDPRILEKYYHGSKLRDLVNNRGKVVSVVFQRKRENKDG